MPNRAEMTQAMEKLDTLEFPTETEWSLLWEAVLAPHRNEKGYPSCLAEKYYFHVLIMFLEAEKHPGTPDVFQLASVANRYANLFDDDAAILIPFIGKKLRRSEQRAPVWLSFLHTFQITDVKTPRRYTKEEHIQEVTALEPNPETRIHAVNMFYRWVKDAKISDPEAEKNSRVELGSINILQCLIGQFEDRATGDQMLNSTRLREEYFISRSEKECFLLLMYLLDDNLHSLGVPYTEVDREVIISKGLRYLKKNMPTGLTLRQVRDEYPIVFDWLDRRLPEILPLRESE